MNASVRIICITNDSHTSDDTTIAVSSISNSSINEPQKWTFYDSRRTLSVTVNQTHGYSCNGQTTSVSPDYKNTLDYCTELKKRNKNSDENRIAPDRYISQIKWEIRPKNDELSTNESTRIDRFDVMTLRHTPYRRTTFTENNQPERSTHLLTIRQPVQIISSKPDCNIPLDTTQHSRQVQTEQPSSEITPRPTRQCAGCIIEQSEDQFEERYNEQCQHVERIVCNTCVYSNMKSALEDMGSSELICPEPNCQARFGYNEVRQVLLKGNNQALFDFYDRQLTHRRLEQMSEFSWCPYPDCGSGQLNERNNSARSRVMCTNCKRMMCSFHRTIWHTGMTCDEYDRSNDKVDNQTKKWLDQNSQQCPQCKSPIQKDGGCDHIICKKCHQQFCRECLADHKLIHTQGLRQHKSTCSHYPKLVPVAVPVPVSVSVSAAVSVPVPRRNTPRTNQCILS